MSNEGSVADDWSRDQKSLSSYQFWGGGHLMLYHATWNHAPWNLQKTDSSSYELATKSLDHPISEEGVGLATYEALLLLF
jgi:hypothetical protein